MSTIDQEWGTVAQGIVSGINVDLTSGDNFSSGTPSWSSEGENPMMETYAACVKRELEESDISMYLSVVDGEVPQPKENFQTQVSIGAVRGAIHSYPEKGAEKAQDAPRSSSSTQKTPPMSTAATKKCSSCNRHKAQAEFDGRATCNVCRPKKRAKQANSRVSTKEEQKALQDEVNALRAELQACKAENAKQGVEIRWLRGICSGLMAPADEPGVGTSSTPGAASGAASGTGVMQEDGEASGGDSETEVAGLDLPSPWLNTFRVPEMEQLYQKSDTARTQLGFKFMGGVMLAVLQIYCPVVRWPYVPCLRFTPLCACRSPSS